MSLTYKNITVNIEDQIGVITLNRPKALNALNRELMEELVYALRDLDQNEAIRAIVLAGSDRAFAAGADIKEMADGTAVNGMRNDWLAVWDKVNLVTKPIIAAVSGHALGGGCELALACDMIIASETARFAQPEINLGIIPGFGGSQRLTRLVGSKKAMEMVLTGRTINAQEAYQRGLVNKVVPVESYLEEAKTLAREIAGKPPLAVKLAKESVLKAMDTGLSEGLQFERKNFHMLFATADQKEGMKAFMEKRPAAFVGL